MSQAPPAVRGPRPEPGRMRFRLRLRAHLSYTGRMDGIFVPTDDRARARGQGWLARGQLRPTRQRMVLAALLVGDGEDRHVTAESLFDAAQAAGEPVSLATVYNTLRAFCAAGLMQEITVDGSRSYFDTRVEDHPHFYWEDSAHLTDAPAEELEILRLPRTPEGAEVTKVDVIIRLRRR